MADLNWGDALSNLGMNVQRFGEQMEIRTEREIERRRKDNIERQRMRFQEKQFVQTEKRIALDEKRVDQEGERIEEGRKRAAADDAFRNKKLAIDKEANEALKDYRSALTEGQKNSLDWQKTKNEVAAITESYSDQINQASEFGDEEKAQSLMKEMRREIGLTMLPPDRKLDAISALNHGVPMERVFAALAKGSAQSLLGPQPTSPGSSQVDATSEVLQEEQVAAGNEQFLEQPQQPEPTQQQPIAPDQPQVVDPNQPMQPEKPKGFLGKAADLFKYRSS